MATAIMATQQTLATRPPIMTDPEWIALESIEEQTRRFIFDDAILHGLSRRGLVEPDGDRWQVTEHGQKALSAHEVVWIS